MNQSNGKEVIYELVNVEGLAEALSEEAWKEEVSKEGIPEDDLYEEVERPTVYAAYGWDTPQKEKQVRAKWVYTFMGLYDRYKSLIEMYRKDA